MGESTTTNSAGTYLQHLKVGTLNCQGISDPYKRSSIFSLIRSKNLDVVVLQETNIKPHEENMVRVEWGGEEGNQFQCAFSNYAYDPLPGSDRRAFNRASGVAIFCCDHSSTISNIIFDTEGRYLAADLKVREECFRLVVVHIPHERGYLDEALENLHPRMYSENTHVPIIVVGDFNFVEHGRDRAGINAFRQMNKYDRKMAPKWKEFCDIYDLKDPRPTGDTTPRSMIQYSRAQSNIFSRIDRFYMSSGKITTHEYITYPSGADSDHDLVCATISMGNSRKWGPGRFKCNQEVHNNPDFTAEMKNMITVWNNEQLRLVAIYNL